jgi:hypothetical protein
MSRRSHKAAPVTVIYADRRTEIREASSFQKRTIAPRGRTARASARNQRRQVSVALAQGRTLDRQWREAEARDEACREMTPRERRVGIARAPAAVAEAAGGAAH